MVFVYVLMALVGASAAIFAIQNLDPVVIRFLGWRVEGMPVALVILLSAFIGVVFAALSGFAQQWRLRSRVRQLENQVAQLSAAEVQRGAPRPTGDSAKQ
jgi:uncharacterized integral membrane protein